MRRRFGEGASVEYLDAGLDEVREEHGEMIAHILEQGLLYPVTVIDGEPVYDGAVSHAVILRAVQMKLEAPAAG